MSAVIEKQKDSVQDVDLSGTNGQVLFQPVMNNAHIFGFTGDYLRQSGLPLK